MPKPRVKTISFREQDSDLFEYVEKQANVSIYMRELIRRDMQGAASDSSSQIELLNEIKKMIENITLNQPIQKPQNENLESFYNDVLNLIEFD